MASSQVLQNPDIFGRDSSKFNHTRFMFSSGASPEVIKKRFKYSGTVFAGGSYHCTGINLAYMELYVGTAMLVRGYQWELSEGLKKDGDWLWQDNWVAWKIGAPPVLGARRR
jgi:hypothetical protein